MNNAEIEKQGGPQSGASVADEKKGVDHSSNGDGSGPGAPTAIPQPLPPIVTRRLITLNIAHGRGLSLYQGWHSLRGLKKQLERITSLLDRFHPDVVCLQEVDESSYWNKHLNLLEEIQNAENLPYAYLGVHNRRKSDKQLAYGNAFLSRYPIRDPQAVPFGQQTLGEKGFLYGRVEFPEATVPVVNVHLDFKSRLRRLAQVERLIEFLHEELVEPGDPLLHRPVVCGDFNARSTLRRDAVAQLFHYMQQHHEYELLPERARSFPAHGPVKCIDFIFLPRPLSPIVCRPIRSYVSDHRPVYLEFGLPRRAGRPGVQAT